MIHLKVTPDSRVDNQQVEQLAQTLCISQTPLERWHGKGFTKHHFVSFETILKKNQTIFVFTVQDEMETVARKAIETTFPRASVEAITDPLQNKPSLISTLELKYHYMFAIKVDRRENSHLSSILETLNLMADEDEIYIQSLSVPASSDWYQSAVDAYERFKKGDMPQKFHFNKQGIAKAGLKGVGSVVLGAINIMQELATGEEPEKINLNEGERALILRDGSLSSTTLQKVRGDAYDISIRIGIVCTDSKRVKALMRMVTMAFRELDGDNSFIAREVSTERAWQRMYKRDMGMRIQSDYLSMPEVSRLYIMPSGSLQERYHIPNIQHLEVEIPNEIMSGGMYLGDHELKGKKHPVYQPTTNEDILCLPNIVIGPMGSGKTKGYGANAVVQAVKSGYGAISIDAAKGEIGDEIEKVLPPEQVVRINLSRVVFGLDWCEVKHSLKSKGMLADSILAFFEDNTDSAGAQTQRFLEAAVYGMQTGRLKEVIRIFQDKEYRANIIQCMPDTIHKTTLREFSEYKPDRQRQIIAPVFNRLNVVLGDEWLLQCMESDNSLDMVRLMSTPQAIIFDVLKKDGLTNKQIDLIVNLLTTKINLAMQLRRDEDQFPFFIVYDEPHRFLRSATLWKDLAVESRKWRIGFVWMFHSWEQIPKHLGEIIKSAGPHYHIYSGASKKTWRDLAEEILPYKLEDAMKLPQYHAINCLWTKEGMVPFICKMALPPSQQ